jgi:hypothetical protein
VAIAVLVIVGGLIVGVVVELAISKRQRSRGVPKSIDPGPVKPSPPQLPQPRFIDDAEGFRIVGPVEYEDPAPAPREHEDNSGDRPPPGTPN